jgi:transcriptional regulator with XRE-family HTH domain
MPTYSASAQAILDRIQGDPKGARHVHRYRQLAGLARQIRTSMDEQGISIRELASRIGTSASQVQRMISLASPANLTIDSLLRLTEALGIEMDFRMKKPGRTAYYVQNAAFPVIRALSVHANEKACDKEACGDAALPKRTSVNIGGTIIPKSGVAG